MAFLQTTAASISSGGTINGDITIKGDLTVDGNGAGTYDEIINGNLAITATSTLWLDGGSDTGIRETSANNMLFVAAGTTYLNLDGANSKVVFNDDGGNIDFIVEGDNNANLLFVDAGNDRVGIGTGSPASLLHIYADDNTKYQTVIEQDSASTGDAALKFDLTGVRAWLVGLDNSDSDKFKISMDANDLNDGNAITIDTSLNVGIGTSSPADILHLVSASDGGATEVILDNSAAGDSTDELVGFRFRHNGGTAARILVGRDENFANAAARSGFISFRTSKDDTETERMRIASDGKVSIGTTTPNRTLSVSTNLAKTSTTTAYPFAIQSNEASGNAQLSIHAVGGASAAVRYWNFQTEESGVANAGNIVFQQYGGEVGIGTVSPDGKLHVHTATAGSVSADGAADDLVVENSGAGGISILTPNDALGQLAFGSPADAYGAFIGWKSSDNQMTIATANAGDSMVLQTANKVTALTIDSSQNVGIGTSSPEGSVDIIGVAQGTVTTYGSEKPGLIINQQSATDNPGGLLEFRTYNGSDYWTQGYIAGVDMYTASGNTSYAGGLAFYTQPGGTTDPTGIRSKGASLIERMRIDSSGNVQINGAGNYSQLQIISTGAESGIKFVDSGGTVDGYIYATASTMGFLNSSGAYTFKVDANSRISLSNNDGNTNNTVFGYNALTNAGTVLGNVGADHNVAVGHLAMGTGTTTTAEQNVAVGNLALEDITTGNHNIAIGSSASAGITTANDTVFIGGNAGQAVTVTGTSNVSDGTVAIGKSALAALTSGADNLAVGYLALDAMTNGDANLAIGRDALGNLNHTDANNNIAIGAYAGDAMGAYASQKNIFIGYAAGSGTFASASSDNIAIGHTAMNSPLDDSDGNIAIGSLALQDITTADMSVVIGYHAGREITTGNENTVMGSRALGTATTATYNVSIGGDSMYAIPAGQAVAGVVAIGLEAVKGSASTTTGIDGTVAVGRSALKVLTTGTGNTAVGYESLKTITTGTYCTAVGYEAGELITGSLNTVIGYQAADLLASGTSNTIVGGRAFGAADGSETNSVVIGADAGSAINHDDTDGNVIIGNDAGTGGAAALIDCVAIGYNAMNSTGGNAQTGTVAIGHDALTALTTGTANTAVGYLAADSVTTGSNNTVLGYEALPDNVVGSANTAIGRRALYEFVADTNNHGWNTAVGQGAGYDVTTGTVNTLIGNDAGNTGTNDLTTGDANTLLGSETAVSTASASNQTVIGYTATGQANNSVTLGNADVTDVFMGSDKGAAVRADNNKVVCQGVEFPDTQSASGDANILDDYEEGTWTPTDVSGASLTASATAYGKYTKIGNVVHAKLTFSYPATSNTSIPRIGGLPYAAANDNINDTGVYHAPHHGELAEEEGFGIRTNAGATYIELIKLSDGGDAQNDDVSGLTLNMSITYWA